MSFVNLHSHSEYSLLDGIGTIKEIVSKAKDQGSPAIAITDHGNCNAWVSLAVECKEKGIKPIFGTEMYYAADAKERKGGNMHLIVLAKNKQGFENLLKLNGWAHKEGFYRKPRVDFEVLKKFKKGIIVLSGCTSGLLSKKLIDDKYDEAESWAKKFQKEFGEDYYLEMQVHDFKEQVVVNKGLIKISKKLGIKTVITNDFHYVNEEDGMLQDVMALIKQKKTWKDRQEALDRIKRGEKADVPWELGCKQLWMKDKEEMIDAWKKWHKDYMDKELLLKSIKETVKLSEKVDNIEIDTAYKFPNIDTKGKTIEETFEEVLFQGFKDRGFKKKRKSGESTKANERMMYEYKVLKDLGLLPYFVILADAIKWARANNIMVGGGRGSAAGSLVCYCLGITGFDPIRYGLMFERFISPARKDMPDIDVDFESANKEKVEQYLISKYGEGNVGHIATYGMMQLRSSIKDVTRVMGGDFKAANFFSSSLPADVDKEIKKQNMTLKQFKEQYKTVCEPFLSAHESHGEILKTAWKLKGRIRHISQHPAGIIITPKPLDHLVALQRHSGKLLVGWTEGQKKELTPFGFVKYDLLGLRTLDIIKRALKLIEKKTNNKIDIETIPDDDEKVYKKMRAGKSLGSFQFETDIMMMMLQQLKPGRIEDLSALNALDRPGPLRMGMDKVFYSLKAGEETKQTRKIVKKFMRKMFPETYGIILYQEQVMTAAMQLADFSVLEADDMRRTITKLAGKWDKPENKKVLDEVKGKFLSRAAKKIGKEDAAFIWQIIFKFTEYGFNKAHSMSYALIGYQCMWLKVNYPVEFFCGMMQFSKGKDLKEYIVDAKTYGIEVKGADINKSGLKFKPTNASTIRFPLSHLRDVKKAAIRIKEDTYTSFDDFLKKIHGKRVNKKAIMSLIKAGAFDRILGKETRSELYYRFLKMKASKKDRGSIKVTEWSTTDILKMEKEAYDFDFSSNLMDRVFDSMDKRHDPINLKEIKDLTAGEQVKICGVIRSTREFRAKNGTMAFVDIGYRDSEASLTIFGDRWQSYKSKIKAGVFVHGTLTISEYREKKNLVMSNYKGATNYLTVYDPNN